MYTRMYLLKYTSEYDIILISKMEYSLIGKKKKRITPLQTKLKRACIIYQIVNLSDDVKRRGKEKK